MSITPFTLAVLAAIVCFLLAAFGARWINWHSLGFACLAAAWLVRA